VAVCGSHVLWCNHHETPLAIESLILLTNDCDRHVRDWATFALGTQIDLDTPAIRGALVGHLSDPDNDTRGEALVGVPMRKDERVIPVLKQNLSSDGVSSLAIEAAELSASNELHSRLIALRK
jgi:HEAT repeat protein